MPTHISRQRAAEAFKLRGQRYSWREVADLLGYRSIGAAQTAVNRHVSRERRGVPTETSVEAHKFAIEGRTRDLENRFDVASTEGDADTMVALNREIARNEGELAKLAGMYAPELRQVDVNVTQTLPALIADTRQRMREVLDAEVVELPRNTSKELAG
ncbi:hypothetical protein [Mycobacterium sp. D16R24]|uniref:hypothetical protein n=1 Tax=Mycobacterium sp. D16R24 TaxID=1855656 RepID=UPI0011162805|nr:hypothetical protein [Mycobacterium sp. D16R24]